MQRAEPIPILVYHHLPCTSMFVQQVLPSNGLFMLVGGFYVTTCSSLHGFFRIQSLHSSLPGFQASRKHFMSTAATSASKAAELETAEKLSLCTLNESQMRILSCLAGGI